MLKQLNILILSLSDSVFSFLFMDTVCPHFLYNFMKYPKLRCEVEKHVAATELFVKDFSFAMAVISDTNGK